jgi:hypothetical protein
MGDESKPTMVTASPSSTGCRPWAARTGSTIR